jgi:hypothetical protein
LWLFGPDPALDLDRSGLVLALHAEGDVDGRAEHRDLVVLDDGAHLDDMRPVDVAHGSDATPARPSGAANQTTGVKRDR